MLLGPRLSPRDPPPFISPPAAKTMNQMPQKKVLRAKRVKLVRINDFSYATQFDTLRTTAVFTALNFFVLSALSMRPIKHLAVLYVATAHEPGAWLSELNEAVEKVSS